MSARKLQAELDRTFKKVREGVEEFESLHDKLQTSTNHAQKEKMEADLKTMIKKLQRHRDQIKTWLQSNEIKDKTALVDNRRLIETQMEKFKVVEKEMKTKAFSKEGLAAVTLDPADRAKLDATSWLSDQVDELAHQVEAAEAEIEQLGAHTKKGRKGGHNSKDERIETLKSQNETRQWHISRLELLLRIVENGTLEPESIDDIKDEVDYFVGKNSEEDMVEYDGIYDQFGLDDEEEKFGLKDVDEAASSHESVSAADDPPQKPKARQEQNEDLGLKSLESKAVPVTTEKRSSKKTKEQSKDKDREKESPTTAGKSTSSKGESKDKTVVPPADFTRSDPPPSTPALARDASPPKPSPTTHLPPLRYATAAAAAMVGHGHTPQISETAADVPEALADSPSLNTEANKDSFGPVHHSGIDSVSASADPRRASSHQASPAAGHTNPVVAEPPPGLGVPRGTTPQSVSAANGAHEVHAVADQLAQQRITPSSPAPQAMQDPSLPSALRGLTENLSHAKQSSLLGNNSSSELAWALEASGQNMPDALDSKKPQYYTPKTPYPTPAYYPQTPLPIFSNPELYTKLDLDTLFFIFYYQQGSYHQYLAARELKRQSWRFHKQFLTWFQRHTEPSEITDEYELGAYIYFDWEGSWLQRKKNDFRFEYRWLEA